MPTGTMVCAILLVLLGSGGVIVTKTAAPAMVAFFGLGLAALAMAAGKGAERSRWATVLSLVVAVVGMLLTVTRAGMAVRLVLGTPVDRPVLTVIMAMMSVICLVSATVSVRDVVRIFRTNQSTEP